MSHRRGGGRDRDQGLAVNSPCVLTRYRAPGGHNRAWQAIGFQAASKDGQGGGEDLRFRLAGLGPWQVLAIHTGFF